MKHKLKYLTIFIILLISGLAISWLVWYLNAEIQQARQYKKDAGILTEKIQEREKEYEADTYGGETPQQTYKMFLEALKKEDIDLASKYFILDKQQEYKQFFTDIKNNNKWDEMMRDLLKPDNQKGQMKENHTYVIRVYNNEHYLIAQPILRIPFSLIGAEKKPLSNIWKMVEF